MRKYTKTRKIRQTNKITSQSKPENLTTQQNNTKIPKIRKHNKIQLNGTNLVKPQN